MGSHVTDLASIYHISSFMAHCDISSYFDIQGIPQDVQLCYPPFSTKNTP